MSIATMSALFQETKEMPDSASLFVEVAANPVLQQLTQHGICKDPVFRFTRAVINGYIHPALDGFTLTQLQTARELVEFWLFPTEWSTAIAEELAFHEWVETDTEDLPSLLATEATRLVEAYQSSKRMWEINVSDIFSNKKSRQLDSFLGRRVLNPNSIPAQKLEEFLAIAIAYGHHDVVELFHERGVPFNSYFYSIAVIRSQQAMIKWMLEHDVKRTYHAIVAAAQIGDIKMFHKLLAHGFPFNTNKIEQDGTYDLSVALALNAAAKNGHLPMLKEIHQLTTSTRWSFGFVEEAIEHGHLEILEWVDSIAQTGHTRTIFLRAAIKAAAFHGNLELVKQLTAKGALDVATSVATTYATSGTLECLKWMIDTGYPVSNRIGASAITYNHTDMVEWLIDNGHVPDLSELYGGLSLTNCSPSTVAWLVERNIPISQYYYRFCQIIAGYNDDSVVVEVRKLEERGLVLPE